jgi:hypothetical protein
MLPDGVIEDSGAEALVKKHLRETDVRGER